VYRQPSFTFQPDALRQCTNMPVTTLDLATSVSNCVKLKLTSELNCFPLARDGFWVGAIADWRSEVLDGNILTPEDKPAVALSQTRLSHSWRTPWQAYLKHVPTIALISLAVFLGKHCTVFTW